MTHSRARALLKVIRDFEDNIVALDNLQAGDIKGVISPIKHRIRDALQQPLEELRGVARDEYLEEQ